MLRSTVTAASGTVLQAKKWNWIIKKSCEIANEEMWITKTSANLLLRF